jgi:DNA-binding transcriptional ArsR family regulator
VTTQIERVPSEDEFQSAVGMLKLLGDETRLRIIWALLDGEHSVNELAELVGAHPAGVSQHLAKLRLARLVRTRRDGTRIYYVADDAHVRRLVEEVLVARRPRDPGREPRSGDHRPEDDGTVTCHNPDDGHDDGNDRPRRPATTANDRHDGRPPRRNDRHDGTIGHTSTTTATHPSRRSPIIDT